MTVIVPPHRPDRERTGDLKGKKREKEGRERGRRSARSERARGRLLRRNREERSFHAARAKSWRGTSSWIPTADGRRLPRGRDGPQHRLSLQSEHDGILHL